ncbi:MAG TPA: tyrosine-type recombinase/integrase [Aquaticitalea sp.]|nr:tyrosine-type recombinase/integrase [Aquaticitalea sp.]HNU59098.1 tyrosine-type recombinase/integrase [Aquaticitalea sp.]
MIEPFTEYLLREKNYSPLTVQAYRHDLETFSGFLQDEYGITSIESTTYQHIRAWVVQLVESGVSNRSINRKTSSLNTFFKFLLKIEAIDASPMAKHKVLKAGKKVQVPFSEAELQTVLAELSDASDFTGLRNRLIVELFYATGIRRIELVQIKLVNIDLSNRTLKVLGKRNKERYIPLIDSVVDTARQYLEARQQLNHIQDPDYLFLTQKGLKIYENLVYRIINRYLSNVSSKAKTSPHIIRHTFATHLLNEGANLNDVKELLGHTSLAATQVYTHNSIAELKKAYASAHPRSNKEK